MQLQGGVQPFASAGGPRSGRRSLQVLASKAGRKEQQNAPQQQAVTRRELQLAALVAAGAVFAPQPAQAGFKKELKKKKVPIEDYTDIGNGLKIYETAVGRGAEVKAGTDVTVHFDCKYRGIDVVSSRQARLLGGNRTVAEPLEFVAGETVAAAKARKVSESAGGLFSGGGGPRAPPALSTAVIGMRVGGKRSVMVPPELGFGDQGEQEIPPGATFELQIEVLGVK